MSKERRGGPQNESGTSVDRPASNRASKVRSAAKGRTSPKSSRGRGSTSDDDAVARGLVAGFLLNHFWLKLIAVLCALSLYAFIHSAQNTQRTIAVKLVAQSPPEAAEQQLLTDLPGTVDVTLIGPRQQLETIAADDHSITLDLSAARSGSVRLVPSMIADLPPRVRVIRLYPAKLDIRFEKIVSRAVDVHVTLVGKPAKGMEVKGDIQHTPKDITVVGITSEVETLQSIDADPFQVTGLGEGTHTRQLRLAPPPEHTSYSTLMVSATVQIGKRLAQRQFDKVPVSVIGIAHAKVSPAVVQVRVVGLPDDVDALDEESISARVQITSEGGEPPKSNSLELEVKVPIAGVQVEVIPNKVVVSW